MVQHRIVLINEYVSKGLGTMNRQINATTGAHGKLNKAMGTTQKRSGSLLTSFTKFRWTLVNVAMAAGLVYGAYRILLKPAMDLETSMVTVRKRTNMTTEAIKELETQFIDLSRAMPVSAKELADIGAVAGQLGIRGSENILEFSRVIAMMGSATVLTTEEAALALGKLSQAFDFPITQAENMGSVINELSNTTAANSKEIVSSMTRMAASAHLLGITADMAAAISATLIDMGMRAERVGTRMRTVFTRMATQTTEIASLFRDIGGEINVTADIIKERIDEDANKVFTDTIFLLTKIESGTERVAKATEVFGRIGATAVNSLVASFLDLQRNIIVASEEYEKAISLQREYTIALETTANQASIWWGNIKASVVDTMRAENSWFGQWLQQNNIQAARMRIQEKIYKELEGGIQEFYNSEIARQAQRIRQSEGEAEAVKFLIEQYEELRDAKKEELAPGEEEKRTQELTDLIVARYEAYDKGIYVAQKALREEDELISELNNLRSEQADKIKTTAEERAKETLGINEEVEALRDLSIEQETMNEELRMAAHAYIFGHKNLEIYRKEVEVINEKNKDLIEYNKLVAQGFGEVGSSIEASTTAVQDFYKETGILVDSLNELRILQELIAKGERGEGMGVERPGRPTPKGRGGEDLVLIGGIWRQPSPTGQYAKLDDFISRPGQPIQGFNPQDTIVGVKDTGKAGGITIGEINISGVRTDNPQDWAEAFERNLRREIRTR